MEKLEIKQNSQQLNAISIDMVNLYNNPDTIKSLNNRIWMHRQLGTFEPHKMAKHTFCPTLVQQSAVAFKKPTLALPKPEPEPRTWFTELFNTIVAVKKKLYQQSPPRAKTEVLLLSIKQADQFYCTYFVLNNRPFPMQRITGGEDWGKKKYAVDREWLNHFERLYFKFYYKEPYVPLKADEFAK